LFFQVLSLFGETIPPFVMPSARASAMGGIHTAYTDDFYALFTNPASFVDVKEEFSAVELSVSLYGPVFELLDLARNASGSSKSLDLSGLMGPRGFAAGLDIGGPLSLGWIGRGLALGLFNRTKSDAVVRGTMIRPLLSEEILLAGGYSFRILDKQNHILDAGFLGKGFFRGSLAQEASIFNALTLLDDPFNYPFKTYLGLGFDLGLRYSFAGKFSAALVCYDIYSPVLVTTHLSFLDFQRKDSFCETYATVQPRLDFGLTYRIESPLLSRYISRLIIALDYRNFLDLSALIPRNPILNIGAGMELVLLEVLSLRAGIADGLPSAGFGLDLAFMRLDFSMYGKELGLDPGVHSVYAMALSLIFRY
jgi:hypothetical protein